LPHNGVDHIRYKLLLISCTSEGRRLSLHEQRDQGCLENVLNFLGLQWTEWISNPRTIVCESEIHYYSTAPTVFEFIRSWCPKLISDIYLKITK